MQVQCMKTSTTFNSRGRMKLYEVEVTFAGNIPSFKTMLYAFDEENAKLIATYEASNKGWPRDYEQSFATQCKE